MNEENYKNLYNKIHMQTPYGSLNAVRCFRCKYLLAVYCHPADPAAYRRYRIPGIRSHPGRRTQQKRLFRSMLQEDEKSLFFLCLFPFISFSRSSIPRVNSALEALSPKGSRSFCRNLLVPAQVKEYATFK